MTIPSARTMWRRGKYALLVASIVGLAACSASGGSGSSTGHVPTSASSAEAQAMAPAAAANAEITSAGYKVVPHVPEFGKGAVGINLTASYRYMGALIMKDAKAAQDATSYFDKHPQTGVTVTTVNTTGGTVLLVIKAKTLKDAKNAAEALAKAADSSAKSSL